MNMLASRGQLRASFLRWALFVVPLVVLLGYLSGQIAGAGPGNPWFDALTKPGIFPPPETIRIVWAVLFVLMGLALAMVCAAWGARGREAAIYAFAVQFVFLLIWTQSFFGAHQMTIALLLIAALVLGTVVTIVLFWRVRRAAALLLLPYLAWVIFAGALNYEFARLNPQADGADGSGPVERVRIGD